MRQNSASQIELWIGCQRAWAIRYILKIVQQQWSARFGSRGHEIAQLYMRDGKMPDPLERMMLQHPGYPDKTKLVWSTFLPGLSFQAGLHLLPEIGKGRDEGHFRLQLERSIWQGYKDWSVPPEHARESIPEVWDWKFSGDIHGDYIKTGEKLKKNPAALLYAADAMVKYQCDEVDLYWIYFLRLSQERMQQAKSKQKPGARQIYLRINRDEVQKGLEVLDRLGYEVREAIDSGKPVSAYPQNPTYCKAYGGCPYANTEHCQLTQEQKVLSAMSPTGQADPFEAMLAAQGIILPGEDPPPPPPAPQMAPPPPPLPSAVPTVKRDPLDVAEEDGLIAHPDPEAIKQGLYYRGSEFKKDLELIEIYGARAGHTFAQHKGINPPENPNTNIPSPEHHPNAGAPREESAFAAAPQIVPGTPMTDRYSGMNREELKAMAVGLQLVTPSTKVRDEGLREMLRKSDARGLPTQAAPVPPAAPIPTAPVPPPFFPAGLHHVQAQVQPGASIPLPPTPPPAPIPAGAGGFHLYINCRPHVSLKLLEAGDIINQAHIRVQKNANIPDYRFADFGKGKGLLAIELSNVLREVGGRLTGADVVVDTRTDLGRDSVDILRQFASKVVQAF